MTAAHEATPPEAVEREAKLAASDDFVLPDLTRLAPGLVASAPTLQQLDAVYYDTEGLHLARAGVTLRHRSGESGPPWTLKLPHGNHAATLSCKELLFEGPLDSVPDKARDLVRVYVRARPLIQVVRLRTNRTCIVLAEAAGGPVLEVVDDAVEVFDGERLTRRFREVEVELASGEPRGSKLLEEVTAVLVKAGCRADPPLPKAIRALGPRAQAAPEVVVPTVHPDATMALLARHAIARSVAQIMSHDPGIRCRDEPDDIHQFRVGIRRLRSDLRTFAELFDGDWVSGLRSELAWLGAEIGSVRDADVLFDRLRSQSAVLTERDAGAAVLLLARLTDERNRFRAAALEALRSQRYDSLVESLVHAVNQPPFHDAEGRRRARKAALRPVRRQWRRLARAVRALDDDPPDTALHRVRILAKRCRYAAEAAVPVTGKKASEFAKAVAEIQTVLGDHQDAVIAEVWLRSNAVDMPDTAIAAGELIAVQLSERARLRRAWPESWEAASAKKLRRWLD